MSTPPAVRLAPRFNQPRGATNLLVIDLSLTAYRKLMASLAATPNEVSGLGIVSVVRGGAPFEMRKLKGVPPRAVDAEPIVFRVDDVELMDRGTHAYTEIPPHKLADYIHKLHEQGISARRIRLWWHRHPLTSGWSGTDENTARNEPLGNPDAGPRIGWALAIVYCTETGWNARYDQWGPDMTLELPLTVEGQAVNYEAELQRQVKTSGNIVAVRKRCEPSPTPIAAIRTVGPTDDEWEQPLLFEYDERLRDRMLADIVAEVGNEMDLRDGGVPTSFVAWDVADAVRNTPLHHLRGAIITTAQRYHIPLRKAEQWADEVMQRMDDVIAAMWEV